MAFEFRNRWHTASLVWLTATILLAFIAGTCCAMRSPWWVFFSISALISARMMICNVSLLRKRMRYVMEATLSGDFSYKFPTGSRTGHEREDNEMLNRIVEHLENLTNEARRNEVFLARIINLADIGLVLADANGDISLHNEAALCLLERQALTHICQIPAPGSSALEIRKRDVTVNERSYSLFTITDLSRKMQGAEVESWEKLTRVLTHEIMNSLTPIQSIAESMEGKASDREATEAFATISSSSRSLMQFVRNFREFNRLPEPYMRVIYLKPLLESAARMAENYISVCQTAINILCFPPDVMLYTDETLLRQVLLNILKNAIEANAKTIDIEATVKADESVEIDISNDGDPIPEETAGHIFTPFFTTRERGSGIGLSLSRRIITHLGGTLSCRTHPLTSFSIRL